MDLTLQLYDAADFESTLKYIYTSKQGSGNCLSYINAQVSFASPIPENHSGSVTSFGYYKYELKFYVYGIDNNGNETLVKTRARYRNDYDGYPNTSTSEYLYYLYDRNETPFFVGDLSYESYYAKIRITKIITNNDPGLLLFFPESHWEQKDKYPQPICGDNVACATNFARGLTIPSCVGADENNDTDGDNIPNDSDNCPNNPNTDQLDTDGDGIGDVCDPSDNNAKPNLTLSKLTITVDSKTYNVFGNTNNVPEFKYGENHTFNITIKNDDDGYSASSKYKLLVSEENKYPNIGNKPVYEYRTINGCSIEGNSEKTTVFSENIYDNISTLNLENDKTYYMFIDIDPNNNVDESNENANDNIKII
ncbi:thrombospondin type 3 repeat-containing protein [Flavivirga algicola]|uniref:thrombospondin type 3 repeat-containing protein n=1 Tax=Flavivirga algicola TaxID=2729136 RepID=UPI0037437EF5